MLQKYLRNDTYNVSKSTNPSTPPLYAQSIPHAQEYNAIQCLLADLSSTIRNYGSNFLAESQLLDHENPLPTSLKSFGLNAGDFSFPKDYNFGLTVAFKVQNPCPTYVLEEV